MDTEWSVAAAHDDPMIVVPWSGSPSGVIAYLDIKNNGDLIEQIEEAQTWPELRQVLTLLNAPSSEVCTSKCDAWVLDDDEKQLDFGLAVFGFGMYIDVLHTNRALFYAFEEQRARMERWADTLRSCGPADARVDFVLRPASWMAEPGFAVTVYVFGYGEQEAQARSHWSEAAVAAAELVAGFAADAADDTIGLRASSSIG